jgi:hypothetical protein
MTAINVVLQRERGIVLSDALIYEQATGRPVALADKCVLVEGTGMAVASRGDYRVAAIMAGVVGRFYSTIDQVIEDRGEVVQAAWQEAIDTYGGDGRVQIIVIGWSSIDRCPRAVLLKFDNEEWFVDEVDEEGLVGPMPDEVEFQRLESLGIELGDADEFDPRRDGILLMEAQRRMKLPAIPGGKPSHGVGGHILLTEVTAAGIVQQVIHTWPDEPGQPIQPAPFRNPNMNRQQRRALERTASKRMH